MMRLQTFLARAGVASRRSSEAIINSARVAVNGHVVRERGISVDPEKDRVEVDGKAVSLIKKVYYILNKPKAVISTVKDRHASRTVIECLRQNSAGLYPVGRLDKDTTGIILLTNDGELTHLLTHPRFGVKKVYRARVDGFLSDEDAVKISGGVELEDGITSPCVIRILSRSKDDTDCEITIREGRKRQIRRMFAASGHDVMELKRVAFAGLELGDLGEGESRKLTGEEVALLRDASALVIASPDLVGTKQSKKGITSSPKSTIQGSS